MMRISTFLFCAFLLTTGVINGQNFIKPLWTGDIPNAKKDTVTEYIDTFDILIIHNVDIPDIAVFLPSPRTATGEAVVICPGGGYGVVVYDWEGADIARALNAKGIAAIVLKYRLPSPDNAIVRHASPLLDAQQAMRMVRYYAPAWNIQRDKIGIMGFSAGGHLASMASTHFDEGDKSATDSIAQMSCRPDFSVLIYAVLSLSEELMHAETMETLLGENPSDELINYFSSDKQVTAATPPTMLLHAIDDEAVPVANSTVYFSALIAHEVPAEIHIYSYGKHGFGLAVGQGYLSGWMDICTDWIKHTVSKE